MSYAVKQVVAVRRDLGMRKGKACAQAAHAAMAFLTERLELTRHRVPMVGRPVPVVSCELSDVELEWVKGSFAKVVVYVSSEEELRALHAAALGAGLESHLVEDEGMTEFHGVKTATAVGIGPDTAERLAPVTGSLPLW